MNYQRIYDSLIASAVGRSVDGYTESHHIIPRCMGGMDDASNLVRLTAEEHFVAHKLLVKIHPNNGKLAFAMLALCMNYNGMRTNNKLFGWVRRRVAEAIGNSKRGVKRHSWVVEKIRQSKKELSISDSWRESRRKTLKGKPKSAEHNAKVSAALKGRKSPMKGRKHTAETKAKMRAAATGRKMKPEDIAKAVSNKSPEARKAAALKAWETKRRKAQENETKPA